MSSSFCWLLEVIARLSWDSIRYDRSLGKYVKKRSPGILFQSKTPRRSPVFLIEDEVILETSLRWVRTLGEIIQWMISAIQEVPWLIKIQRASADKVKIGSLTQNLSILGELIFLTQFAARVQLVLNLKFQNSRVLETIVFLALFSRRKVSVYDWMSLIGCIILILYIFLTCSI